MKRILIIEDEEGVRKPLEDHLKREGYAVATATTGAEGNFKVQAGTDLIVVDWMLPDTQGIELIRAWRAQGVVTPAILLTARTDLVDKVLGLELGANDYVTKPFEPRELVARIRVQLRASTKKSNESDDTCLGDFILSSMRREVRYKNELVDLTKTEFDLLKLLIENPDQVFSREEILKKVWGYDNYPTTRTVDTHILQLRQKFASQLFETVHGIGYRFRAEA